MISEVRRKDDDMRYIHFFCLLIPRCSCVSVVRPLMRCSEIEAITLEHLGCPASLDLLLSPTCVRRSKRLYVTFIRCCDGCKDSILQL